MEGDGLNTILEAGGQGSIEKQPSFYDSEGLSDTKENLLVLTEFRGNCSLGDLRGMGAEKETGLG